MNISFDLDSTLIPNGKEFKTERRGFVATLFKIEKIRKGAPELFKNLQELGHQIHIYTTSFRSKTRIRLTLMFYGIKVNRIVNQTENQLVLRHHKIGASKFPPLFGFDIHIDDSKGVGLEGEKFKFKTIIISPNAKDWNKTIIHQIRLI